MILTYQLPRKLVRKVWANMFVEMNKFLPEYRYASKTESGDLSLQVDEDYNINVVKNPRKGKECQSNSGTHQNLKSLPSMPLSLCGMLRWFVIWLGSHMTLSAVKCIPHPQSVGIRLTSNYGYTQPPQPLGVEINQNLPPPIFVTDVQNVQTLGKHSAVSASPLIYMANANESSQREPGALLVNAPCKFFRRLESNPSNF